MSHGDIHGAVHFNLASPAVYLATWLMLMLGVGEIIFDRPLRQPIWNATQRPIFILTILLMGSAWIMNLVHYLGT